MIPNPDFATRLINEGTIIDDFWHQNRFPGAHSVVYKGKYYTVYRNQHGYPTHFENGAENSPNLEAYEKDKKANSN